jgi:hypothetical protein
LFTPFGYRLGTDVKPTVPAQPLACANFEPTISLGLWRHPQLREIAPGTAHGEHADAKTYLEGRWKNQSDYFEAKASQNQRRYIATRRLTLISSWLTPIAIFGAVLMDKMQPGAHGATPLLSDYYAFVPLILSTVAIGAYQWEELHNYGPQWAKFRLVAERLKNHKQLFTLRSGIYRDLDDMEALRRFVEYCEGLIEGTDVNYFILMVDPRRRENLE